MSMTSRKLFLIAHPFRLLHTLIALNRTMKIRLDQTQVKGDVTLLIESKFPNWPSFVSPDRSLWRQPQQLTHTDLTFSLFFFLPAASPPHQSLLHSRCSRKLKCKGEHILRPACRSCSLRRPVKFTVVFRVGVHSGSKRAILL